MKLSKRTGAVLGFLLAAGSATAATGWLTNYTWTFDTLKKEPIPAVLVTDDDDGTWTTVKTGTGLTVNGTITASTTGLATSANQDSERTLEGALTETAPATDTASSGLNGRLQRIAQRLTSLIGLLPTALGAGGGLKVDGSGTALPVSVSSNAVGTPLYTSAPWCPVAATSSVAQLSAATDNQSVSTGCTGACQKSVCKNLSQTDILCVRPSSGGNRTCLLPGDSVEYTANTSCFFDNSAAPAVTGTQYVTALGCDP